MVLLLALACRGSDSLDASQDTRMDVPGDSPADDSQPVESGPATVVLFTVDTLNEDWLIDATYDASPAHDRVFSEGVVLKNTVVTRGITVESLPSIATGTFRRTHRVTDIEVPEGLPPMIQEYYASAGYRTFGYSSNFCEVIESTGWERFLCTGPSEFAANDLERDTMLIDKVLLDLGEVGADDDLFIWLHVRDPHSTHTPREPWISEFWGDRPQTLGPISTDDMSAIMLGREEKPEGFDEWLEAVYASQLASSDEMFGRLIGSLEEMGRWEEAIVVTGTDHGEELGAHHDYYFHGCSPFDPVVNTTWGLRAPGISPGVVEDHLSSIDMLPTMLALSGLEADDVIEGVDIVPLLQGDVKERGPVYFERGEAGAGVVNGSRKLFISGTDQPYQSCAPFNVDTPYPGPMQGFWDLESDPDEDLNLIDTEDVTAEKTLICTWVTEKTWIDEQSDRNNRLVQSCKDFLGL